MFFNWACVPSSNCVGAECFKDTCSKDAVFFSLGSCGLVEAFFPHFGYFGFVALWKPNSKTVRSSVPWCSRPCWIILTNYPQGFFNLSGLLHGGCRVAMSSSISHRQQKIIFLRLWEASASRHSFSFIPKGLAICPPCRTDPWCLVVWFRLRALGCPAPDESLCEARGFWSQITIGDSSSDSRCHQFHRPCVALSEF